MSHSFAKRRYAVIGNPVRHSLSPWLHARFAHATQRDIVYAAYAPPIEDFARFVSSFFADGGCGLNITIPFKEDALRFADSPSNLSRQINAANVLAAADNGIRAYNTDGAGLISDIVGHCAIPIHQRRVLLAGAGGAARAVAHALCKQQPTLLCITNRSAEKGKALAHAVGGEYRSFDNCKTDFDIIINATACGLTGAAPPLPPSVFDGATLAYDISYGKAAKPFMTLAKNAAVISDGLGMLVEQAALSFALWEGTRPQTAGIIRELRKPHIG